MITPLQKAILVGSVLGDGGIYPPGGYLSYNWTKTNKAYFYFKQSPQYTDYVFWLYDQMKNLCPSRPKQRKDNGQWYFYTSLSEELMIFRKKFYGSDSKKIIPLDIGSLLTDPLSLAVWYMDDGSLDYRIKSHYNYALSTNCFSLEENKRLSEILYKSFGIVSSVQNPLCRGIRYPELYIGVAGRDKFIKTIKPYLLPCFKNKIPPFEL